MMGKILMELREKQQKKNKILMMIPEEENETTEMNNLVDNSVDVCIINRIKSQRRIFYLS